MKTTMDLPGDLPRRAEAEAALCGKKLRELVLDGLQRVLADPAKPGETGVPSAFELMKDGCGIVRSGLENEERGRKGDGILIRILPYPELRKPGETP